MSRYARKPRTALQLIYVRAYDAFRRTISELAFREVSPRMAEVLRLQDRVTELLLAELESRGESEFECDP